MNDNSQYKIAQLNDKIAKLKHETADAELQHDMLQSWLHRKYPTILQEWESGKNAERLSLAELNLLPQFSKINVEWQSGEISNNVILCRYDNCLFALRSNESILGCRIGEISNSDTVLISKITQKSNKTPIELKMQINRQMRINKEAEAEIAKLRSLITTLYNIYGKNENKS